MNAAGHVRLLLDLLGSATGPDADRLSTVAGEDWSAIDRLAEQHRVQPLLHARHRDNAAIPAPVARRWREAHRNAALLAMAHQAEIVETSALLRAKGFDPLALKGAYLAWHAYPEPAQRPMRDIDLLLSREQVLDAFHLLCGAGYRLEKEANIPLEDVARLAVHMPLLITPRGVPLELHMRLSEPEGKLEYHTPELDERAVIAGAVRIDGQLYPNPQDMLAHLVNHAIFGHRLDCGPLLLTDIHYLTLKEEIDWPQFWRRVRSGGWESGARLVIELVRAYHGDAAIPRYAEEPEAPPPAILAVSRDLLLQDYHTKKTARFMATLLTGGLGTVFERITGKVKAKGEGELRIDRHGEGGSARWALSQFRHIWSEYSNPDVRRQSRQLAQFKRWLDG